MASNLLERSLLGQVIALLSLSAIMLPACADAETIKPPEALQLDGIPPISADILSKVGKYTDFEPAGFVTWHPTRLEMLVTRRHKNTPHLFRVTKPGEQPELVTDFPEPVQSAKYRPTRGDVFLFGKDSSGSESFRLYRYDTAAKTAVAISPEKHRVQEFTWSHRGDRVLYTTVPSGQVPADQLKTDVHIATVPISGKVTDTVIAQMPGTLAGNFSWSTDDKRLVYIESVTINESYVWLMDPATGERKQISEKRGDKLIAYDYARFRRDGKGFYVLTDRDVDYYRLGYIDFATKKYVPLTGDIPRTIDDYAVSPDGRLLAIVINEEGAHVMRLVRTADGKVLPLPKLPVGTIENFAWHQNSAHIGLTINSSASPAAAYSIDVKAAKLTKWTRDEKHGIDPATFVQPEVIRWQSFDKRTISGFLYRAPVAQFPGKRPVLINIHGGPEAQFQPRFMGIDNYYVNELGASIIHPNVRGSWGFGQTFLNLDNGKLREDSVKDIGALLDWIATQPDLDPERVLVMGRSYGGYMALAVSMHYADRIRAAIDVAGFSNFVTQLEGTEAWRRDWRRQEFGDERDPDMRAFLENISPRNHIDKIKKPILVVHGKNDTRVPVAEAEQMVASLKKNGTPVWYVVATDEGHRYSKKDNVDFVFYATVEFIKANLLGGSRTGANQEMPDSFDW